MANWINLPADILLIIFTYVKQANGKSDLLSCRLTSKRWSYVASQKLFRDVIITRKKQMVKFLKTLEISNNGRLIRYLENKAELKDSNGNLFPSALKIIAMRCTDLQVFSVKSGGSTQEVWKSFAEERQKGNFKNLRTLPIYRLPHNAISEYEELVFSLKESLWELVVYNNTMLRDETKLWYFPKVDTAFFKFGNHINTDNIDLHLKRLPSCTAIDLDFEYYTENENQAETEFSPYFFSQIKKLNAKQPYRVNEFYEHIIETFPCLEKASITMERTLRRQMEMTTGETLRFLNYISNVPYFSIDRIPTANVNDILMSLNFSNRRVKSLQITYKSRYSELYEVSIKTCPQLKEKIIIDVRSKVKMPLMLPPLGFIENSGKDINYLDVDMGPGGSDVFTIDRRLRLGITLAYILEQCPSLLGIRFTDTVFKDIGIHVFRRSVTIPEYFTLKDSMIYASFFPSVSSAVTYISQLVIYNCMFIGEAPRGLIREIVMPGTELDTIIYEEERQIHKVHLKVSKTMHNVVDWYLCDDSDVSSFSEEEYNKSLKNQQILSIFIQCKNVSKIIIRLPKVKAIIKI